MAADRCVPLPTVTAWLRCRPPMTRLLIIEDNPELVANLYGFFEPLGYVLDDARDGATGLRMATQHDYDAILLDLMLPRLDGMALCRKLREEYQNPVPVLMLTARDPVDDRVQGLAAGGGRLPGQAVFAQGTGCPHPGAGAPRPGPAGAGHAGLGRPAGGHTGAACVAARPDHPPDAHHPPIDDVPGACRACGGPQAGDGIPALGGRSRPRAGPCARTSMTCASRLTKTSRTRS